MGFERNFITKIPSNQLSIKKFSTWNKLAKLNPWFVTGAHLTNEGLAEIRQIKDGINTGRKD
jgi:hypothetical protein